MRVFGGRPSRRLARSVILVLPCRLSSQCGRASAPVPTQRARRQRVATQFAGKRVLVAGAGVSGRSAAEALVAAGATVTVTDASSERLAALASLRSQGVQFAAGLTAPESGTDLVVTSPGWRPDAPLLVAAEADGVPVIGEVELAWRLDQDRQNPAVWLAVTGTNGKTTTVSMLEAMLRAGGVDAVACGNVGLPVVDAVRAEHRVLAVELSSFQLYWAETVEPRVGAVLNLTEDHLDWHGTLAAYGAAKARIYRGNTVSVYNADEPDANRLASAPEGAICVGFTRGEPGSGQLGVASLNHVAVHGGAPPAGSPPAGSPPAGTSPAGSPPAGSPVVEPAPMSETSVLVDRAFATDASLVPLADVQPPGPHNVVNALAAAAIARAYGSTSESVAEGLRTFNPGAHRSVPVGELANVSYVDDSKATNPHAADAALRAHRRVVWIAGGLLKGAEVDQLVAANADRLDAVVLIGQDRAKFTSALARHAPAVPVREVLAGDDTCMPQAVRMATELAGPGSVVLLAPAAASMDMFTDYAHRGRAFVDAVEALSPELGKSGEPAPRHGG